MGDVYRARDTRLGREVALKVLPASFVGDPDRLARFERELVVAESRPDSLYMVFVTRAKCGSFPCFALFPRLGSRVRRWPARRVPRQPRSASHQLPSPR